jgi:sialidase-1
MYKRGLSFAVIIVCTVILFYGITLLGNAAAVRAEAQYYHEQRIFTNGTEGYAAYRIPAMDLLAFASGRVNGSGDFGNMDIVMKRSTDNGETWSALQIVAINGDYVAGNPGPVVDTMDPLHPNRVWLAYNISSHDEATIRSGTGVREVMMMHSDDHGATWSSPVNITSAVHKPNETTGGYNYTFSEDWRGYAITPGHNIQLTTGPHAGRLLFVANHSLPNGDYYAHSFYSDDHGSTWTLGGNIPTVGLNECEAVQLANGDIMINMRNIGNGQSYRAVSISTDGGTTWGSAYFDHQLPEPRSQASIIRYTTESDSGTNRILFSNPANTASRSDFTVKLSYDEGRTWAVSKLINAVGAYSDLVIQNDMKIGVLYERNGLQYARFNLEWLTDGTDSLSGGNPVPAPVDAKWDSLSGWITSGTLTEIAPAGQLHLKDNLNALTNVYRTDRDFPSFYTLETRAKIDDYTTTATTSFGTKVQNGSYRLMLVIKSDGFYIFDSTNTLVKKKAAAMDQNWHVYKAVVSGGNVEVFMDGVSQFSSTLQTYTQPDRIEHFIQSSSGDAAEVHVDYTTITYPLMSTAWDSLTGWSSGGTTVEIAPAGQLHMQDHLNTLTNVYQTSFANIPQSYTLETRAKIDDYTTTATTSFGTKVQDGSYRLMLVIKSDGLYMFDSTNTLVKKKAAAMDQNWHVYKAVVNSGSVEVFMDGVSQFSSTLQSYAQPDRIEHFIQSSGGDAAEVHVDYTLIY